MLLLVVVFVYTVVVVVVVVSAVVVVGGGRLFFVETKIPVSYKTVNGPESRVFCSVLMLPRNPNLCSLGSFDLRIEDPNVSNLNPGLVEVTADQI